MCLRRYSFILRFVLSYKTGGAKFDQAALAGTGTTEPLGIRNVSGITTGTGYNYAQAQAQVKNVANSNCIDENIKFLTTPALRETLSTRAQVLGTGTSVDRPVWQDNMLAGKAGYVSGNVPSAHVFCGDFSRLWLLAWNSGIMLESDPYQYFQSDTIVMKVSLYADVACVTPGAFAVGTGVT